MLILAGWVHTCLHFVFFRSTRASMLGLQNKPIFPKNMRVVHKHYTVIDGVHTCKRQGTYVMAPGHVCDIRTQCNNNKTNATHA